MIAGLEKGVSQPLDVLDSPNRGRGVFALAPIAVGSYVTDYKYRNLFPARKMSKKNKE